MNDFDAESKLLHRFRALRTWELQQNLTARHQMTQAARSLLCRKGFLELETPMLVAPEVADGDALLVTLPQHPDVQLALSGSPQLAHQLLMVAGYDRCFQFSRRFRDAPAVPESTRLDFEMSFVGLDELISAGEEILAAIVAGCERTAALEATFTRLTRVEAIRQYGTARPDLRLGMEQKSTQSDSNVLSFLWVTELPWLELDSNVGHSTPAFDACAMPLAEDLPKLSVQPELVRSSKFELILNGVLLASGSLRIHQAALQQRMLEVLGIPHDDMLRRFGVLLEALHSGAPPHGGLSIDCDRLVMLLLGANSLDEVVAFPKSISSAGGAGTPNPSTH